MCVFTATVCLVERDVGLWGEKTVSGRSESGFGAGLEAQRGCYIKMVFGSVSFLWFLVRSFYFLLFLGKRCLVLVLGFIFLNLLFHSLMFCFQWAKSWFCCSYEGLRMERTIFVVDSSWHGADCLLFEVLEFWGILESNSICLWYDYLGKKVYFWGWKGLAWGIAFER